MLFIADIPRRRIYYFNSLSPTEAWLTDRESFKRLWAYFLMTQRLLNPKSCWEEEFVPHFAPFVEQPDKNSCGIFVMLHMQTWRGHVPSWFGDKLTNPNIIEKLRERFCADLLLNDINKHKSFVEEQVSKQLSKLLSKVEERTSTTVKRAPQKGRRIKVAEEEGTATTDEVKQTRKRKK